MVVESRDKVLTVEGGEKVVGDTRTNSGPWAEEREVRRKALADMQLTDLAGLG